MSSQNPNRPRRRIAGEQKTTRPDAAPPSRPTKPAKSAKAAKAGKPDRPPPTPSARRRVPGRVLLVLGVLAAVLVAIATVGVAGGTGVRDYLHVREQGAVEDARRTAPAAAERAATAILAYDHQTLEADRDAAVRFMTGDYRRKYEQTFGLVLENAPQVKAVVTAQVKASGVVHADPGRVNVLLFVNQRTVSTAHSGEPQLALNRVVFAMEEAGDGTWLVDDITAY